MTDDLSSKLFSAGEAYTNVETFAASSKEVNGGARRLEGAFYGSAGYRAMKTMTQAGFEMTSVGQLARVIWLGPFGRTYVDDPSAGVPFLSSAEMLEAKPNPKNYISKALTKNLDRLIVCNGTILVSCSGAIGNVALWTADLDGMAVSQHAIRIIPADSLDRGLIYAFLRSKAGQFLVKRNKSGSVVESIYEADVSTLPLPLLPRALRREMTRLVDEACALRVKANRLIDESVDDVQRVNYLRDFSELRRAHAPSNGQEPDSFVVPSATVCKRERGYGDIRLDATTYAPVGMAARRLLLDHPPGCLLSSLVQRIHRVAPGKRTYADDEEHGVALIGGKQMMQIRPSDVKYLSRACTIKNALETALPGTTLVSTGGTLGRTMFVHRNLEDAVASEDVMRLVPNEQKVCPGYLFAFMSSEYAQEQLALLAFGSVIPRLRHFQFHTIAVRVPNDRGRTVHDKIIRAFDSRADAIAAEDQAQELLAMSLARRRDYIESEWGSEY